MKKLSVVVCGWHYPNYFYKQLPSQDIPDDWEVDYFCISHRNPKFANRIPIFSYRNPIFSFWNS